MVEVFVYDFYITIKQMHNQLRSGFHIVDNIMEQILSIPTVPSRASQPARMVQKRTNAATTLAIRLLSDFEDRYYSTNIAAGETIQEVVRSKWGTRIEVSLIDFINPIQARCKELRTEMEGIPSIFQDVLQSGEISVETRSLIHQAMEIIDSSLEFLNECCKEMQDLLCKDKRAMLVWDSKLYQRPTK